MRQGTSRKRFIVTAATGMTALGFTVRPVRAATFEYKAAHDSAVDHPLHLRQVDLWDAVRKETNGQLSVQLFPNSQLGSQSGMLTQLRAGAIQFLMTISAIYSEVVPVAAIDNVAFAFGSARQAWSVMDGPLGDLVGREFEAKGLHRFKGVWDNGLRQMTNSMRPIKTAGDLEGLKIRIAASKISVDLFKTLGASPTPVTANEIYVALQTHIVDGQETPYSAIEKYKFYEVQKFLSVTNHMYAGDYVTASGDAWKALPPDIQAVVERNVAKFGALERVEADRYNSSLIPKLKTQGLAFNDDVDVKSMRTKLSPYYVRWKAEFGPAAWDLLEQRVGPLR